VSEGNSNSSRPSGADTRQRILIAAVELFSANSYAGTSVRDIADALRMTKAALYYHFAGKEEILQAVTAPLHEDMDNLIRWAAGPPRPGSAELLTALVNLLSRHGPLLSSVFGDPSVIGSHRGPGDDTGRLDGADPAAARSLRPRGAFQWRARHCPERHPLYRAAARGTGRPAAEPRGRTPGRRAAAGDRRGRAEGPGTISRGRA
jgi:AcrR family transcriptional regulator